MGVIGYSTIGANSAIVFDQQHASYFTATEAMLITDIEAYMQHTAGGPDPAIAALYSCAAGVIGALRAYTGAISITSTAGWYNFSGWTDVITNGRIFANGDQVALCIFGQNANIGYFYDAGGGTNQRQRSTSNPSYPTLEDPFVVQNNDNEIISIKANYVSPDSLYKLYIRKQIKPALFKPGNSR